MTFIPRSHISGESHPYVSPIEELNAGIWTLFLGATLFLAIRLWCKISRKHGTGMWYDDYILIASWLVLFMNDILISVEYATGYLEDNWDARMRIMVNISSCGTLFGQAWTKTAFGVALLRISNRPLQWILWFCIITMQAYMIFKCILQWGKVCEDNVYWAYYRFDFCTSKVFRDEAKEVGNIYNLLMDFVFAIFPWLITWNLKIARREKISLCITLSLGMIIAVSTAVRTAWNKDGNDHDEWYFWNNAMSQIWFSSEICGTIIVQCIPIMRPFLKEVAPVLQTSFAKRAPGSSLAKSSKDRGTRDSLLLKGMDKPVARVEYSEPVELDRRPSVARSEDTTDHQPQWAHISGPAEPKRDHIYFQQNFSRSSVSPRSDMHQNRNTGWPFGGSGSRSNAEADPVSPASWLGSPSPDHSLHEYRGLSPPPSPMSRRTQRDWTEKL